MKDWLIGIFSKLVARRIAYFLAPFLIGLMANHWWIQDTFHSWNFDPNNMSGMEAVVLGAISALLMLGNEWVAWKRNRANQHLTTTFGDLVVELHKNGKLEEFAGQMASYTNPAIKTVLCDYATRKTKEDALRSLGAKLPIVAIFLLTSSAAFCQSPVLAVDAPSQLMPEPKVEVNTNTIAALAKAWTGDISTPLGFFGAVKDSLNFYGVYSWTLDGDSGAGAAAQLVLFDVVLENVYFEVGPALVVGTDKDNDLFQMVQMAVTMKLVGDKFQAVWETVPVLAWIPIDWTGFYGYVGFGAVVDGIKSWEPIGFGGSVGGGGIRWGKGKKL